jgi:hypothetical protein
MEHIPVVNVISNLLMEPFFNLSTRTLISTLKLAQTQLLTFSRKCRLFQSLHQYFRILTWVGVQRDHIPCVLYREGPV